MVNQRISIATLSYNVTTEVQGLPTKQANELPSTPLVDLTEDQPAFMMSLVDVDIALEFQQEGIRELIENTNLQLVLTRGDISDAQLQGTLDGDVWDATPAEGDSRLRQVQDAQRIPVCVVKPRVEFTESESGDAVFGGLVRYQYTGPPLNVVKKPFTFPENVGWKWSIFNNGPSSTSTACTLSGNIRHWGKWL